MTGPGSGQRQRGFTLLELAVVVSIIGILAGALLSRINLYQERAEMAAMDTVVGVIRSALGMKLAQLVATGRQAEMSKLATINPMDLLAQKPANYAGEYYSPQNAKISPGNWYFNRKELLLVYIRRTGATFQSATSRPYQYKIELVRGMDDAKGLKPAGTSQSTTIEGVALNQVPWVFSASKQIRQ